MSSKAKPKAPTSTEHVEPVQTTFTQDEIDAHLSKIVVAATERHGLPPRTATAYVVNGRIRCQLEFSSLPVVPQLQIPRHAGPRFHVMSGQYSTACRATVPRQAGPVRER
jgi:hypothetical protein